MCEKYFFFTGQPPPFFYVNPRNFYQKTTVDKDIPAKKESMVKLTVELPYKPALFSPPHQNTNNRNNALITG